MMDKHHAILKISHEFHNDDQVRYVQINGLLSLEILCSYCQNPCYFRFCLSPETAQGL